MLKAIALVVSHGLAIALGFALGVYALPILIAPSSPAPGTIAASASQALYSGQFRRDLKDSDALHWGEGAVSVGRRSISLAGKLAPGPDYKLYLSPQFVETESEFGKLKPSMVRVGDVRTFDGFVVAVPESIDVTSYNTVVVWCETFGQFITAAKYR